MYNPPFEHRSKHCVHEQWLKLSPVSKAAGMDCECPLTRIIAKGVKMQ